MKQLMKNNKTKDTYQPAFGIDVSISFVIQVLTFGLASVTSIIIARSLGPSGKGIYSLAIMIPAMAATLISMGIDFSNMYFIGKKKYPIGSIVGNAFFCSSCFGGGVVLLLLSMVPFLTAYFLKGASRIYLYTTVPIIPFLLLFGNIYYILLGYRNMLKFAVLNVLRPFSYLAMLVLFYYFFKLSVYRAVWAYIFGLALGLSIGIYFLIKSGYCIGLTTNKKIFVEALKFGSKQHLGTIFQFFNYRLDVLIIAALLTNSDVGLYSVAVLVGGMIWYIPNSLGQILYPKIASSDIETANKFTPLVCRNTVLLTSVATLILYGVSGTIIPWLFTDQFVPSVMALKLLLPGVFFLSISKVLGSDLTGRGFPQYSTFASFVSLVLTVTLDLLLIPRFGINGASVASSISYMVNAFVIIYLFIKNTGIRIFDILIFKAEDIVIYQRLPKALHERTS